MESEAENLHQQQASHPREFQNFTYAYPVISRRSGGVSIGLNLNLDKACNFDCPYCQVDRTMESQKKPILVEAIKSELDAIFRTFDGQGISQLEKFRLVSSESKKLTDIAISGDGEPTMALNFAEVCKMVAEFQKSVSHFDFKLILITNSTLLDRKNVEQGITSLLSKNGEVWAKLDAGTEEWFQKINISKISLDKIERNLIQLGAHHPYKIQSLFCRIDGELPSEMELSLYLKRLQRIKESGSNIKEVQLHTLARKPALSYCTPVNTEFLHNIQARIETELNIYAQVYGIEN